MKEKLNSKQKLVILLIVLGLLIIGANVLKSFTDTSNGWNYKEITSATDVISSGSVVTNRKIYYELEDIIIRFLLANDGIAENNLQTENVGYEASYKDYYSILTKDYKKHLSKKEFNEKAASFINKFVELVDIEEFRIINTKDIISKIYAYRNNNYLCELKNGEAYIGIVLDEYNSSYNIFYIE